MDYLFKTDRFLLRQLTEADATGEYLRWFDEEGIKKYILSRPTCVDDLKAFIDSSNKSEATLLLGIFSLSGREHIGNIKFELDVSGQADLGILIGAADWRGKKVAAEVIAAAATYLATQHRIKTISLGVEKENSSAIRAYQKLGFVVEKDICAADGSRAGVSMSYQLPK